MSTFALSEIQAKAILEMRLQRLTGLERQKIVDELEDIVKKLKNTFIFWRMKKLN
ncbi:MAG: hypothetical protein Ct9H300mP23_04200 [Nitrospinota bacterium]|nr:MAG: hypothetical protein Ct9H300mP23_04200 [Nitrospinota bacterium]